jgi:hypothetical protein
MAFTRKFLKEQGVPEDKIDVILAERNRAMNDYILKTEAEEQLQKKKTGIDKLLLWQLIFMKTKDCIVTKNRRMNHE